MGRKALGRVPITRRVSPGAAVQLQTLERMGYSLDDVIHAFVGRNTPAADLRTQPAYALLEALRYLYSRGGALPVACDHVLAEAPRCHAGQIIYPGDARFQASPALRSLEGWHAPEHLRQTLLVMRQALEALHRERQSG